MCGIGGVLFPGPVSISALKTATHALDTALLHRGPDSGAAWHDPAVGLAFAHRRLAVIDLSEGGAQPRHSADGRWTITYNGEIYNYQDIAKTLESVGYQRRTTSDTEVLLEAIAHFGLRETLEKVDGIFAFALWDHREHVLTLATDPFGVKPLYYGHLNGRFCFASEFRGIEAAAGARSEIDRESLWQFLQHNCVPAPRTIGVGIQKLQGGTLVQLDAATHEPETTVYWSPVQALIRGKQDPLAEADALEATRTVLSDSVARQMVSDVPVGVLLSGGIDSGLVAAFAAQASGSRVQAFTIGSDVPAFDETSTARRVTDFLGIPHHVLTVQEQDLFDTIPKLASLYDEPFADSSQIPTVIVSQLAREHVTVALGGDGGDEIFRGYSRYAQASNLHRRLSQIPSFLRPALASTLSITGMMGIGPVLDMIAPRAGGKRWRDGLQTAASLAKEADQGALYSRFLLHWRARSGVMVEGVSDASTHPINSQLLRASLPDFETWMQAVDLMSYLPDDLLTKVDRASMSVGLEARVPFLSRPVLEVGARLPDTMLLADGQGKQVLRRLYETVLPADIATLPKTGFDVPISAWLRGPLRNWAGDLLTPERIKRDGLFAPLPIQEAWEAHQRGDADNGYLLWDVLMANAWLETR